MFTFVLSRTRHSNISWLRWIQPIQSHLIPSKSTLILFSHVSDKFKVVSSGYNFLQISQLSRGSEKSLRYRMRHWVGPWAHVDAVPKRKDSCPCQESNAGCPACSLVIILAELPAFRIIIIIIIIITKWVGTANSIMKYKLLYTDNAQKQQTCEYQYPKHEKVWRMPPVSSGII
jgi:hypothetical protein